MLRVGPPSVRDSVGYGYAVFPEQVPARRIERLDHVARVRQEHHAVVDQRRSLVAALVHRERPGQLEATHVAAVDRGERTVAVTVQRATPVEPVRGGRVAQHVVGHRRQRRRLAIDPAARLCGRLGNADRALPFARSGLARRRGAGSRNRRGCRGRSGGSRSGRFRAPTRRAWSPKRSALRLLPVRHWPAAHRPRDRRTRRHRPRPAPSLPSASARTSRARPWSWRPSVRQMPNPRAPGRARCRAASRDGTPRSIARTPACRARPARPCRHPRRPRRAPAEQSVQPSEIQRIKCMVEPPGNRAAGCLLDDNKSRIDTGDERQLSPRMLRVAGTEAYWSQRRRAAPDASCKGMPPLPPLQVMHEHGRRSSGSCWSGSGWAAVQRHMPIPCASRATDERHCCGARHDDARARNGARGAATGPRGLGRRERRLLSVPKSLLSRRRTRDRGITDFHGTTPTRTRSGSEAGERALADAAATSQTEMAQKQPRLDAIMAKMNALVPQVQAAEQKGDAAKAQKLQNGIRDPEPGIHARHRGR